MYIPTDLVKMEHLKQFEDRELFEHYIDQLFRYEFTTTFNPRYLDSIEYAYELIDYVIKDVVNLGRRATTNKRKNITTNFYFNYVVEKHQNGMPHIHGTLFTVDRIKPQTLANWEQSFGRKYGRTSVYATGMDDKMHKNDHFQGGWQDYLRKEGECKMFEFNYLCEDNTENRIVDFLEV